MASDEHCTADDVILFTITLPRSSTRLRVGSAGLSPDCGGSDFDKRVLTKEAFASARRGPVVVTMVVAREELTALRTHPMLADVTAYQSLLSRHHTFTPSAIGDPNLCRAIAMYYQIYLPPVIVTAAEHYLWLLSKSELQSVALSVGIPCGSHLQQLLRQHHCTAKVDLASVIKAIADVSGLINCLPTTDVSRFLLAVRDRSVDTPDKWLSWMIPR